MHCGGALGMKEADMSRNVQLTIPADKAYAPVATLALSGLGMMAGLDVDLLGDLRTVAGECMDCLLHQAGKPESIGMTAGVSGGRLYLRFDSKTRSRTQPDDPLGLEITRGVLETLMPQVQLHTDADGVHGIECSMPV